MKSPIVKFGCCFILALILLCAMVGSCDSQNAKSSQPSVNTENTPKESMDKNDPKSWREEEEKLEQKSPHLQNAKYACKRCGMKSDRPLDDPNGTWGRNGICAYCIDYLKNK